MSAPPSDLPLSLPPTLDADRRLLLQRLTSGLDAPTLWWMSGFIAGLAAPPAWLGDGLAAPIDAATGRTEPTPAPEAAAETLTIVCGSQTGNAKRAASKLACCVRMPIHSPS